MLIRCSESLFDSFIMKYISRKIPGKDEAEGLGVNTWAHLLVVILLLLIVWLCYSIVHAMSERQFSLNFVRPLDSERRLDTLTLSASSFPLGLER